MTTYVFNILFGVSIIPVFFYVFRYQFCQIYENVAGHFFDKEIAAYLKERIVDQREAPVAEEPEKESIIDNLREDPTPEEHKEDPITDEPIKRTLSLKILKRTLSLRKLKKILQVRTLKTLSLRTLKRNLSLRT